MPDEDDLPTRLAHASQLLIDALRQAAGIPRGLSSVGLAVALREAADEALAICVRQARTAGHTWQEIGDVLHTTRQAAFQRFGRPVEAAAGHRTEATMEVLAGAGDLALTLFGALFEGADEQVAATFDDTVRAQMPVAKLADVRLQLHDLVGAYERAGEPFVRRIGRHTVVDVPLEFEAGPMKGRVAYDGDGRVAGLFVLNPEAM